MLTELGHDLGGEIVASLTVLGVVGHILGPQTEGVTETVQHLIGLGQAKGPHSTQNPSDAPHQVDV